MNIKNRMFSFILLGTFLITNAADNENEIKVIYYKNTLTKPEESSVVSIMQQEPEDVINITSLKNIDEFKEKVLNRYKEKQKDFLYNEEEGPADSQATRTRYEPWQDASCIELYYYSLNPGPHKVMIESIDTMRALKSGITIRAEYNTDPCMNIFIKPAKK